MNIQTTTIQLLEMNLALAEIAIELANLTPSERGVDLVCNVRNIVNDVRRGGIYTISDGQAKSWAADLNWLAYKWNKKS